MVWRNNPRIPVKYHLREHESRHQWNDHKVSEEWESIWSRMWCNNKEQVEVEVDVECCLLCWVESYLLWVVIVTPTFQTKLNKWHPDLVMEMERDHGLGTHDESVGSDETYIT